MNYEVKWTNKAIHSFEELIEFVQKVYTQKEVGNLIKQAEVIIKNIEGNPKMYKQSGKKKEVRKGFVNKFVSLFYKIHKAKKQVDLLRFWENRQNPKKLEF